MKKVLGKGLSALIPDTYAEDLKNKALAQKPAAATADANAGLIMIPLTQIIPNMDQPRKSFDEEKIKELAASIQEQGILQPVIVKKVKENQYMLICGERRFRAAALCGLSAVPAVVKDTAQNKLLEWALIENIQRQDLNPLEEAEAYRRLAEEQILSQDEIAKRVGKDRSTVANMLRLLRLPADIHHFIADGRLSAGHARALLALLTPEHQRQLAKRIAEDNLSVRQVEAIVNRSVAHKRKAKHARNLKPEIVDLEAKLTRHFGTQVKIFPKKDQKSGRVEMYYYTLDDLDRILEKSGIPRS